jgi:hypothetical protein
VQLWGGEIMFRYFRLKREPEKVDRLPGVLSGEMLAQNATTPISIRQLNYLPENVKRRLYRGLLPPGLLSRFQIDPLTWETKHDAYEIVLKAEPDTMLVKLAIRDRQDPLDEFLALELQDNSFDGIDLNLIVLGDPDSQCFPTDRDEAGEPTLYGTLRRNLKAESEAMQFGLAPGQARPGLGNSKETLGQLEAFLAALGQRAYFLEPLTYVSAWIFERRGFAYVRGHRLMQDIHREFQPGGALYRALEDGQPFRSPAQWQSVRGRAWAIHDGILDRIDARWDGLRMVKQIGRHAGVETFPNAVY